MAFRLFGRAPQGARGLKCSLLSHQAVATNGRAPQGARGLKYSLTFAPENLPESRAPQGARGLKFFLLGLVLSLMHVAPRKGRVG